MKKEEFGEQENLLSYICNLSRILDSNLVGGRTLSQEERIRLRALFLDSKESYRERFNVEPNLELKNEKRTKRQRSLLSEYSSTEIGKSVSPLEKRILQKAGKLSRYTDTCLH